MADKLFPEIPPGFAGRKLVNEAGMWGPSGDWTRQDQKEIADAAAVGARLAGMSVGDKGILYLRGGLLKCARFAWNEPLATLRRSHLDPAVEAVSGDAAWMAVLAVDHDGRERIPKGILADRWGTERQWRTGPFPELTVYRGGPFDLYDPGGKMLLNCQSAYPAALVFGSEVRWAQFLDARADELRSERKPADPLADFLGHV